MRDYDRDLPRADRARLRAQPGVDEPARERDRRARRVRARSRSRTRRDGELRAVDIADDGPGHPRGDPPTAIFDSFFTTKDVGQRHRPRARHRAHASSSTATTARSPSNPNRAGRSSTFGCRSPTPDGRDPHMAPICTHLDQVHITQLPDSVDGCDDCLAMGGLWLHLRICLECGHVGCCDDSPNRHATAHARATTHPHHPLARAGRGLVVVLRRRGRHAHPGRPGHDAHPAVAAARVSTVPRSGTAEGLDLRQAPARLEAGDLPAAATRGTRRPCRRGGSSSRCRRSGARASSRRSCSAPQLLQRTSVR